MTTRTEEKAIGWITFACVMLFMAGAFNMLSGFVALVQSSFYVAGAHYVFGTLRTWGWIVLLLGGAEILAAGVIVSGQQWGRWVGIAVAGVNALGHMLFLPGYPFWSLTIIAIDLLVIFGLAAYGGQDIY